MDSTSIARVREGDTPKPLLFSLKAPYMEQGLASLRVAETPNMNITIKVHTESDENEIHTHLDVDHSFIVLEGELTIIDPDGAELVVRPYQGVLLPRGTYYRLSTGSAMNTVVLRINAKVHDRPQPGTARRVGLDGNKTIGRGPRPRHDVAVPGKFFADFAGLD